MVIVQYVFAVCGKLSVSICVQLVASWFVHEIPSNSQIHPSITLLSFWLTRHDGGLFKLVFEQYIISHFLVIFISYGDE